MLRVQLRLLMDGDRSYSALYLYLYLHLLLFLHSFFLFLLRLLLILLLPSSFDYYLVSSYVYLSLIHFIPRTVKSPLQVKAFTPLMVLEPTSHVLWGQQ